jgi:hypothetical protein
VFCLCQPTLDRVLHLLSSSCLPCRPTLETSLGPASSSLIVIPTFVDVQILLIVPDTPHLTVTRFSSSRVERWLGNLLAFDSGTLGLDSGTLASFGQLWPSHGQCCLVVITWNAVISSIRNDVSGVALFPGSRAYRFAMGFVFGGLV